MAEITISDIINIGDVSTYLSANYEGEGNLFGERLSTISSPTIQLVTDALRWQWEAFPDVTEVRAIGYINITAPASLGQQMEVLINDPVLGLISMGSVTFPSTTNINDVALQVTNACNTNTYNYVFYNNAPDSLIKITAPVGYGASVNGNNRIIVQIT
jgi:hypothetical protein